MFDIPDAKRVRREDLYASDDEQPSPAAAAADDQRAQQLHDRLAQLYGPISTPTTPLSVPPDAPAPEPTTEQEEAFEFRLFAAPSRADAPTAQRIVLARSDDAEPEPGEGGFTTQRGREWYFAAAATGRRREEFEEAAVSGEVVVRWSRARAWGLERPWRVTVVRTGEVGKGGKGGVVAGGVCGEEDGEE